MTEQQMILPDNSLWSLAAEGFRALITSEVSGAVLLLVVIVMGIQNIVWLYRKWRKLK